jgi:hypothetical protein
MQIFLRDVTKLGNIKCTLKLIMQIYYVSYIFMKLIASYNKKCKEFYYLTLELVAILTNVLHYGSHIAAISFKILNVDLMLTVLLLSFCIYLFFLFVVQII